MGEGEAWSLAFDGVGSVVPCTVNLWGFPVLEKTVASLATGGRERAGFPDRPLVRCPGTSRAVTPISPAPERFGGFGWRLTLTAFQL